MSSQRDNKRWRFPRILNRAGDALNSRAMNIIYPVLLIIIGWIAFDAEGRAQETQECMRDYLVADAEAAKPRAEKNAEKDSAAGDALIGIGDLFTFILANQGNESPEAQKEALEAFRESQKAIGRFEDKNKELEEARKEFPAPPVPENFCKK